MVDETKKMGLLEKEDPGLADEKTSDDLDAIIAAGMHIIHNPKVTDGFIPNIVNSDEPAQEISDLLLMVMDRIDAAMAEGGKKPPMELLALGANEIMGQIVEICEAAGMEPMTDEEKYMTYSLAVSKYIDNALKTGKMTPEELQQLSMQAQDTEMGQQIVSETQNAAAQLNPGDETVMDEEKPAMGG